MNAANPKMQLANRFNGLQVASLANRNKAVPVMMMNTFSHSNYQDGRL